MDVNMKSPPELTAEAEQAHRLAELTVGLCEQLLERAHELGRDIEERVCRAAGNQLPGCEQR
jgi:hypothetical protein